LLVLSFSSVVAAEELELEGWLLVDGALDAPAPAEPLGVLDIDPLAPPALFLSVGLLGVVGDEVAPDEDAAPEGGVLVSRAVRPAPLLSPQAARPRARETAAARMESFMCSPPWLG
jgi:hypothetical protein